MYGIVRNSINYPKGFKTIRNLCIILGVLGIIVVIYIITMRESNIIQILQENNQGFLATSFDFLRTMGFLFGAILIFKLKDYARIIILICATSSLLEMVYNTITSDVVFPVIILVSIIVSIILDAIIIDFFCNPKIKRFILDYQYLKQGKIDSTNEIDETLMNKWNTLKYYWRVLIISLIYSIIMFPILDSTVSSFFIGIIVFLIWTLLLALIVRASRYFVLKNKESFAKILFYTSLFIFIFMIFFI